MSVFHENMLIGASGQVAAGGISRSLRFNSSDSAYCGRTVSSANTSNTTSTLSWWCKRTKLGATSCLFSGYDGSSTYATYIQFNAGDTFTVTNPGYNVALTTSQVFRDPSAWYHFVLVWDTTNATSGNRYRLFVNGVRVTAFSTAVYPSQNDTGRFIYANSNNRIGTTWGSSGYSYCDAYLADVHLVDGQALDPTSFGEFDATTGVWVPKAYTGTYGTNGFKLDFADNSSNTATTLGKDTSGNSPANNWTPNNLSVTAGAGNDSLVDVPTNGAQTDTGVGGEVRGNYCTLNPLDKSSSFTVSNGNLEFGYSGGGSYALARSTIGVASGKWYWEITASTANTFLGVVDSNHSLNTNISGSSLGYGYWGVNGQKAANGGAGQTYGASYTANDIIGVALDLDNLTLTFYKNGTSQGTAFTSMTAATYFPAVSINSSGTGYANFGQRTFAYTAPSGFKALCTANLPAPLVTKPSTVFDTKLYTGNGSTQTISGLGFSPDLVWIKIRSSAFSHCLTDTVRGATKEINSNLTNAESTDTNGLTAFNSDGFSLGSSTVYNGNASTYVAWAWDAGSSTVTNNTAGTITPTGVRANPTAGFSVISYVGTGSAGASIGHGLGVAPAFALFKNRSVSSDWQVYHVSLGNAQSILLQSTAAAGSSSAFNSTSPTSTIITLGVATSLNNNGSNHICYAFAPLVGYSSFGSYTGNGSTDGPFVYTGFRPRFILVKRTDGVIQWTILDTARSPSNVADQRLFPNLSQAETVNGDGNTDLLSNGFKPRNVDSAFNASGGTYIYAAFAESPFNYARAR